MFSPRLREFVDNSTPKLNPVLYEGLAVEHMRHVEEYIHSIFKSCNGAIEGLVYEGCRRLTPQEEYNFTVAKRSSRSVLNVARSDVYLMEYHFSYMGEKLAPKYMYLPFVARDAEIFVSGKRRVISPVLSDRVISIGMFDVFVRLLRAKLTFRRLPYNFKLNGTVSSVQVVWSSIYNEKPAKNNPKKTVKAACTLAHYLFCKYGFTKTMQKFCNATVTVGYDEINFSNFPEDEYDIYESNQIKPKGFGRGYYEPSNIRVAVKKSENHTNTKALIAGFFYCVDHFPTRITPDYVDNTALWMVLLGHVIWSGHISEGKLYSDILDHIQSLDEYIDNIVRAKLKEINYDCTDIYELFMLVITNFNDWMLTSDDRVNTMYDKELSVLYYVCYDITSTIFKMFFKLKAAQKKDLNAKKVLTIINGFLKPGLIYRIKKDHGEVDSTTTSGDNKALRVTQMLVSQQSSNKTRKKKDRVAISDPSKRIHASVAEVGGFANIPKSDPSGRSRLNLFLKTSPSGLVLRNPKFAELIDRTQRALRRD